MVSVAGGWFFLMACEMFVLGKRDFRLPGLGSYLQSAASAGDTAAILWGLTAMITVIVLIDQIRLAAGDCMGRQVQVRASGELEYAVVGGAEFVAAMPLLAVSGKGPLRCFHGTVVPEVVAKSGRCSR